MARPETPATLLTTAVSFRLVLSSTFCTRLTSVARPRTKFVRCRASSRNSRWWRGGLKLGATSPWRSSSAIHSASRTSVLRPGTARTRWALRSQTVKLPSSRLKTGFQNSPVLSRPTWVQSPAASQSDRRSKSSVVVP